jgi:hypothetical protein
MWAPRNGLIAIRLSISATYSMAMGVAIFVGGLIQAVGYSPSYS